MNQSPENKKSKEEYLEDLLTHIESEFGGLAIKYHGLHNNTSEARLDEIYAHVLGGKYAQAESLDLDAVLAQQAQAQSAILVISGNGRAVANPSVLARILLYRASA
ncbi:MAG: hypothetical protein GX279_06190 [Clostridiaceae bacterium]|nr:hypothetical protein [Clostridiaceae bacterium]